MTVGEGCAVQVLQPLGQGDACDFSVDGSWTNVKALQPEKVLVPSSSMPSGTRQPVSFLHPLKTLSLQFVMWAGIPIWNRLVSFSKAPDPNSSTVSGRLILVIDPQSLKATLPMVLMPSCMVTLVRFLHSEKRPSLTSVSVMGSTTVLSASRFSKPYLGMVSVMAAPMLRVTRLVMRSQIVVRSSSFSGPLTVKYLTSLKFSV